MENRQIIKIEKRNNTFCVLYAGEVIFQAPKKEDINEDNILSTIAKIEDEYPVMGSKEKKVLTILGQDSKKYSDKLRHLQNRLIIEDKECLAVLKNLNSELVRKFHVMAAVDNINYAQYNPHRLLKKWLIFLALAGLFYLFDVGFQWMAVLFLFFLITEPYPLTRILEIYGKLKSNS